MNLEIMNRWLSVQEIALYLGVSKETIYRMLERKQIPAHKLGKQWKFKAHEVDAWVTSGQSQNETKVKNENESSIAH